MARGVSTVLDVSVCLLLVGAAMTTLAVGVPEDGRNSGGETAVDADATTQRLSTVTAGIEAPKDRTVHGPLADHLARSAVASASLHGRTLSKHTYPEAVAAETVATTDARVTVTVRWEPYPDAPLRGRTTARDDPPPDADVAVTRSVVATGIDAPPTAPDSFAELARALAVEFVDWHFPPERTRATLVDGRTGPTTSDRYRTMADPLDATVEDALTDADTRRANDRLAAALAAHLEADLRSRYDTPRAAAAASTPNRAVIVVRRWDG